MKDTYWEPFVAGRALLALKLVLIASEEALLGYIVLYDIVFCAMFVGKI